MTEDYLFERWCATGDGRTFGEFLAWALGIGRRPHRRRRDISGIRREWLI